MRNYRVDPAPWVLAVSVLALGSADMFSLTVGIIDTSFFVVQEYTFLVTVASGVARILRWWGPPDNQANSVCVGVCMRACVRACVRARACVCVYVYMLYIYIYIYIYIYMYIQYIYCIYINSGWKRRQRKRKLPWGIALRDLEIQILAITALRFENNDIFVALSPLGLQPVTELTA